MTKEASWHSVRLVDSHAHVAINWYEPIETLRFHLDCYNVARAILVQPLGQSDNTYIQSCRRNDPERYSTIVGVDLAADDLSETVRRLAADGASGLRLRPSARSSGGDGLDVWRLAQALGLAVSVPGSTREFASEQFAELVAALPDQPIVIEHLGGRNTPDESGAERSARGAAFALSRFPNVYLKVPGLGEFAERSIDRNADFPFVKPLPSLLDKALAAFGADRLMWGSDFPLVSSREGYGNALRFCLDQFADRNDAERARLFGGTADAVFPARDR